jgi:nicotinate phosphoribosyltransferase
MIPESESLLTDLYELKMLDAYFASGERETASFELHVRALPPHRHFMVAAGLEQALSFLERMCFSEEEIALLEGAASFSWSFLDQLSRLRFTGDVDAVPEGTIVFQDEPLIRVTAPLPEAQIVETRIMNLVNFETAVASKAARCMLAAPGKTLVDFGLRRAHGLEAGVLAARASFIAGFAGTSTVLAGARFGIPLYGTMAHSFVQAHDREIDAFLDFARANGDHPIFLIDTYDTERGAERVVELAPILAKEGIPIGGVRLDSGDVAAHARSVRAILDRGGLGDARIVASSGLDEWAVRDLVAAGAPIDGFGIGSSLDTSSDAPFLDCAYKLVEYAGHPRRKRSEGKSSWPGRKQVHRHFTPEGEMAFDSVTLERQGESGTPLLVPVMRRGVRVGPAEPVGVPRERAAHGLSTLPPALRTLDAAPPYYVDISTHLRELARRFDAAQT